MKKIWYFIRNIFLGVFVAVWAILFVLWIAIKTPFHYFIYRKSHFYRNTRATFSTGFVDTYTFRLYELIHEHNLPIRYMMPQDQKNIHHGYFMVGTTLLIHDLPSLFYMEDENCWTAHSPSNHIPLSETLADTLACLRSDYPDAIIEDIRILMDLNNLVSKEKERIKADPLFLPYSDNEQMLKVLRNFCTAN